VKPVLIAVLIAALLKRLVKSGLFSVHLWIVYAGTIGTLLQCLCL